MSKRADRRKAAAARPAAPAKEPRATELHITVAAITDMHELDLRHETELVKAALLYADRVTLASPKVAYMASIASFITLAVSASTRWPSSWACWTRAATRRGCTPT